MSNTTDGKLDELTKLMTNGVTALSEDLAICDAPLDLKSPSPASATW